MESVIEFPFQIPSLGLAFKMIESELKQIESGIKKVGFWCGKLSINLEVSMLQSKVSVIWILMEYGICETKNESAETRLSHFIFLIVCGCFTSSFTKPKLLQNKLSFNKIGSVNFGYLWMFWEEISEQPLISIIFILRVVGIFWDKIWNEFEEILSFQIIVFMLFESWKITVNCASSFSQIVFFESLYFVFIVGKVSINWFTIPMLAEWVEWCWYSRLDNCSKCDAKCFQDILSG